MKLICGLFYLVTAGGADVTKTAVLARRLTQIEGVAGQCRLQTAYYSAAVQHILSCQLDARCLSDKAGAELAEPVLFKILLIAASAAIVR